MVSGQDGPVEAGRDEPAPGVERGGVGSGGRLGNPEGEAAGVGLGRVGFEIDWNGDGLYDETVKTLEPLHIYETPGFFRPRIRVRLPDGRYEALISSRILTIHR